MYNFLQKLLNQTFIGGRASSNPAPPGGGAKFGLPALLGLNGTQVGLAVQEPSGIHHSVLSNICWMLILYFLLQFTAVVCTPIWMKTNGLAFARTVLQQLMSTFSRALPVAAAVAAGGGGATDVLQQLLAQQLTPTTPPGGAPPVGAATVAPSMFAAVEAVRRKRPVFHGEYQMGGMAGGGLMRGKVSDLAARVDKAIEKAREHRF